MWQSKNHATPPDLPDEFKKWGAIIGLAIAAVTLGKLLWSPVRSLGRRFAESTVLAVIKRCKDDVRRVLRESVLAEEIAQMDRTEEQASANKDAIEGLRTAQMTQGVALVEIEKAQRRLDLIPESMERIEGAQTVISGQLNQILGRFKQMDEQGEWDGKTDRRSPRGSPPEGIEERRVRDSSRDDTTRR